MAAKVKANKSRAKSARASSTVSTLAPKVRAQLLTVSDPKPPPIPADRLVGEGRALAKVTAKYEKELRRVGIDGKLLRSLADRAAVLADTQSTLALARRSTRSKKEVDLETEGVALRSAMVADGRFALRNNDAAQATLDRIQEGEGLDDLIQDLRDLATFAGAYRAELTKVAAQPARKAKRAAALAGALEELVADRRAGDRDERAAVDLRDRAATHLLEAMREIRAAGTYAFRDRPDVAGRFRGAYDAQRRARGRAKKRATDADAPPADEAVG